MGIQEIMKAAFKNTAYRHVCYCGRNRIQHQQRNFSSSRSRIRIGNVEIPTGKHHQESDDSDTVFLNSKQQEDWLIPSQYLPSLSKLPTSLKKHLQWMMTKDLIKQDILLLGAPGNGEVFRRRLALVYSQLTQKPVEILTISGDLTESDLKQRREIVNRGNTQNIRFVDQAPVRAAKYGRLLILDGIEKAERNILPTLNNLLENREMNLEDGTLLMPPHRITSLRKESSSKSKQTFIPVHPDFRVIALSVPSPPFPGRNLDPPIRSRFQIRRIDNPSSEELYEQIIEKIGGGTIDNDDLSLAKSCAILSGAMEDSGKLFPSNRLNSIWEVMKNFPLEDRLNIIHRAYPITMNTEDELAQFASIFNVNHCDYMNNKCVAQYVVKSISKPIDDGPFIEIKFEPNSNITSNLSSTDNVTVFALTGGLPIKFSSSNRLVQTLGHRKCLAAMIQEHSSGNDILLMSPKGEGKTAYAQEFATKLGYDSHLFATYSEMTCQDLLQRRSTDPLSGETIWEDSPLLRAAHQGDICILDGIEKLRGDVFSSLQSLIVDREISLPDGRRALRYDRFDRNDSDVDDSVVKIRQSFRVIALASIPKGNDLLSWITPNVMAMFGTIRIPSTTDNCIRTILRKYASSEISDSELDSIIALRKILTESVAEECGVSPLSTRNMIQVARRIGIQNDLYQVLSSIFLIDLLPPRQRSLLESMLNNVGILKTESSYYHKQQKELIVSIGKTNAMIGSSLVVPRVAVQRPEMVPSPNAFDIGSHIQIIHDLLWEWKGGERSFLLLGNQGVGKNIIIDRLCQIANWEREYIQLHRDSTIGQLTLTPQLEDGKIVWNDSPLIRAVRDGHVLLIDEADKAPLEVVSVLKGLIEDGELLLADGRRISTKLDCDKSDITVHPNFTIFVLANRPGFPFHGNNFFQDIGDCFITTVVRNPDLESEIHLLTSYAPNLDQGIIRMIASSFSDLRHLADCGDLNYPYSTREAIAVVKHLDKFPNDEIDVALRNIIDYDSYDAQTYSVLQQTFHKHGINIPDVTSWKSETSSNEELEKSLHIEYISGEDEKSSNPPQNTQPKVGKWDKHNEPHVGGNQWAGGTGGSDTAGLGGRGGPFRLDRGNQVHQVSNSSKKEVSEQTKLAARKIAEKALEERLRRIGMGVEEYDMYQGFSNQIQRDVSRLKGFLSNIESRDEIERGWLKRQTYGEIDDAKLVDGITGDPYIYKRRGCVKSSSKKQNNIRFVMDVSGSMYRFNGYDQRLIRCLEAALLVMESFQDNAGKPNCFDYSMTGHNGDSPNIEFIDWAMPPMNEKDRLQVLQTMLAHSQYCRSGDFTLEAMTNAIDEVSSRVDGSGNAGNSGTVICVSDANLARYGIDPRQLGRIIEYGNQKGVKTYVVFIASFDKEADNIKKLLPVGSGHVCMETNELPRAVRDILTSGVFK